MAAYQRFLARDGMRTSAPGPAEVAEAAEGKAAQASPAAEALLKPAEVRRRELRRQQASAGVQQPQTPAAPKLQQPQQLQQGPVPKIAEIQHDDLVCDIAVAHTAIAAKVPQPEILASATPAEWSKGVARLSAMASPRAYPAHAWQQLILDAARFLEDWAPQAAALGWPAWELFGCHRRAPWGRIDGMGLVLLLHGDQLAALTASEAVIRRRSGAHQTSHRKLRDPLTATERCLVWELA
jgi:hypothetical protein